MKSLTFLWHINKYHRLRRLQMFVIIQYTDIKVCCRYNVFTNKIWMYRKIEMHMTSAYPILLLTWQVNKGMSHLSKDKLYLLKLVKCTLIFKNRINCEVFTETINWTSYDVLSVAEISNLIHVMGALIFFIRENTGYNYSYMVELTPKLTRQKIS